MARLELRLSTLRPVFGSAEGVEFVAMFSKAVSGLLRVRNDAGYQRVSIRIVKPHAIAAVLSESPACRHVFCISSDSPFLSPPQSLITNNIKLGVLPLFSTGFSPKKLVRALELIQSVNYRALRRASVLLRGRLLTARKLALQFNGSDCEAQLDLTDITQQVFFFDQTGSIDWGQQSVLPNGEVSLLTNRHGEFSGVATFAIDGELLLDGCPVLHRGLCPCQGARASLEHETLNIDVCLPLRRRFVSDRRHQAVFSRLRSLSTSPVRLRVERGVIRRIDASKEAVSFVRQLEGLMASDANYQKIHEFGFGLNRRGGVFLGENFLPNEMVQGVHFGLGLTPYTEFHLDLVCFNVVVLAEDESGRFKVIHRGNTRTAKRSGCAARSFCGPAKNEVVVTCQP